jgi:outer membrane protein assembly factor BamD
MIRILHNFKICIKALKIFTIFLLLLNYSCSKKINEEKILEGDNIELQMIESYNQGSKALKEGDIFLAAKKFNEAELLYPQSKWAPRSALMAAYAYYSDDYYSDAIFELKRFIEMYPLDSQKVYAHYLLAISYYETIIDEKKDMGPLIKSQKEFEYIIKNYPNTDFAIDAKFKLNLIYDILASKEMYLARYYMNKEKWIPAINRFKNVLKNYDESIYAAEALHRLVEIHYKIGSIKESQKYASMLGYNYLSNEWYKETYLIYNSEYKDPLQKIKKNKKSIIKRVFQKFLD